MLITVPRHRPILARAQPTKSNGGGRRRLAAGVVQQVQAQPNWTDNMATIQGLMNRVQAQLQLHSSRRFGNPQLAAELKAKAERHLETLMRLAESQQQQHIQGTSSGDTSDLQQLLQELSTQLDLEQQAMLTASKDATPVQPAPAAPGPSSDDTTSQQQLRAAAAAADDLRHRLATAEAAVVSLRNQLSDAEATITSTSEELSEHRELQMAYDRQCHDLYRLRMQLQEVRSQGNDAASLAAQATKQHKQDLAWLMDAHRRELHDAHTKNQELTVQVQQLRLKLLEQEQLVWSLGGTAEAQQGQPQQQQQQQEEEEAGVAATQQDMVQVQQQLQQAHESAEQLAAEKQQLVQQLQDSQRGRRELLAELQALRHNAAAAAAAEQALAAQQQEVAQQRDSLQQAQQQVQELQASLQDAKVQAAAAAAAAASAAPAPAAAAAVEVSAPDSAEVIIGAVQGLDAAAAVQQLKLAKREMAGLRVQLADARRELREASGRAAAAEAALQQQAASWEARLAKLQRWYNKQAAVVAQLRRGRAPSDGQVGFTNTNKFWVRQELLFEFLKHWVAREAQLQEQEGFLGLQVHPGAGTPDGGVDVVVSSLWESIPDWEAWSNSAAGTQQHMPAGVYQYVPAKGEGFPEAFVPFREYDAAVNAKY